MYTIKNDKSKIDKMWDHGKQVGYQEEEIIGRKRYKTLSLPSRRAQSGWGETCKLKILRNIRRQGITLITLRQRLQTRHKLGGDEARKVGVRFR